MKDINGDPIIQKILDVSDSYGDDLEGLIDLTLEQIKFDEEKKQISNKRYSDLNSWIEPDYIPIASQGLTKEKPVYAYVKYNIKEQFEDRRKLLLEELWLRMTPVTSSGSDSVGMSCRVNFGVPVVSSIFGGEVSCFEENLPWQTGHPTKEEIIKYMDNFDPDKIKDQGMMPKALECTRYFHEKLSPKGIGISVFFNQSPFILAHLVRGNDWFIDLYDDPGFAHAFMETCTEICMHVCRFFYKTIGIEDDASMSFPYCDDTSILISKAQFEEFSLPYMYKSVKPFSTAWVHFCGDGSHILDYYLNCEKIAAINYGQPEFYNYEETMEKFINARKIYSGSWPVLENEKTAEQYFRRILNGLKGKKQGINLGIIGCEFGMNSHQLVELWYNLQDEIFK